MTRGRFRRHMVLTDHAPASAVDAIVERLIEDALAVPGIQTTPDSAERFATKWLKRIPATRRDGRRAALFKLERVIPPRRAPGHLRQAGQQDLPLLTGWIDAFAKELGDFSGEAAAVAASVVEQERMFLWEHDARIVSMAAWTRPTPKGCAINFVYTPRELRGQGYASNCVAALSQLMLDRGKSFCTLNTDLANPTSNKIYRALGYQLLVEWKQIFFDQ
jgi:GNAT superfamily N-acetyltransferase